MATNEQAVLIQLLGIEKIDLLCNQFILDKGVRDRSIPSAGSESVQSTPGRR